MQLSDLLNDVLGRAEEENPPVFWNLEGEVYPAMVDALFEAALITGVVQLSNIPVTLVPNVTYYSLNGAAVGYGEGGYGEGGYGYGLGIPAGVIGTLRMRAPYAIRKTSLKSLDDMVPTWQQAMPGSQIVSWFPLGVSYFGIYPQLAAEATVTMDFLYSPVNEPRPYTGSEPIPFQSEFSDLLSKYAAAMLRAKEGGVDAEEADTVFQAYLSEIKALSAFQNRVDSLVYSRAFGVQSEVNPRKVV
jgi:hypothetical protein